MDKPLQNKLWPVVLLVVLVVVVHAALLWALTRLAPPWGERRPAPQAVAVTLIHSVPKPLPAGPRPQSAQALPTPTPTPAPAPAKPEPLRAQPKPVSVKPPAPASVPATPAPAPTAIAADPPTAAADSGRTAPSAKAAAVAGVGAATEPAAVPSALPSTAPSAASTAASPATATETATGAALANAATASRAPVQLPLSDAAYLNNPKPPYPHLSEKLGEQGLVQVRVWVDTEGEPKQAQLQNSSGFRRLDQAAVDATLRWRYVPGKRSGVPEAMWVTVPIRFELGN